MDRFRFKKPPSLAGSLAAGGEEPTAQLNVQSVAELFEPRISLLVYHRHGSQMVNLAEGQRLVIGRTPPAEVVIRDASLSREHARVELINHEVWVEDMQSTNGTWVNGKQIGRRTRFKPNDEVRLGAVTIGLHVLEATEEGLAELDSHDAFVERLQEEIVRARTFRDSLTVLLVQAAKHKQQHLSHWYPAVQQQLRPVDRAALYGPNALLIYLPQTGQDDGMAQAQRLVELPGKGLAPLTCGVATFPGSGNSAEELLEAVRTACHQATARIPVQLAPSPHERVHDGAPDDVVVASPAMQAVHELARRVADAAVPVLVFGETGSGKEVLAQTIHASGKRRDRPLRCINCGALPSQLVESILFGHERGAFTGAERQTAGLFEEADGGSVLLDEIGELPLAAQTALLRVIDTRKVTRVGSSVEIPVDVRVIAATHRDLDTMVRRGEFRQDLLYRLNTVVLKVPPLRERPEDIVPLAQHFMREAIKSSNRRVKDLDAKTLELLKRYEWPGNIRELRNVIERAVLLARDQRITAEDLSDRIRSTQVPRAGTTESPNPDSAEPQVALKDRLRRYEAQIIIDALRDNDWNQTRTAKALGMSRRSLVEKIRAYGIKKRYEAD